jgi:hypothetical protein
LRRSASAKGDAIRVTGTSIVTGITTASATEIATETTVGIETAAGSICIGTAPTATIRVPEKEDRTGTADHTEMMATGINVHDIPPTMAMTETTISVDTGKKRVARMSPRRQRESRKKSLHD